ncbi:MAG: DinB family protein [Phycisphaerae bacterium]|nr:DinB family protein [Phycisphaerae bacterium]
MTQTLESMSISDLLAAYAAGPAACESAVAGLTGEQLRTRPVAGKWSTLEALCHISDTEQLFADRIKRTMAMDRPLLLGAAGSIYPVPIKYQERDVREELDLIRLTRAQMVRILKLQPPHVWERTAVHSEVGLMTLWQLLQHAVRHLALHLAAIAEKRAAMGV